jgi:hypothetical protein
MDPSLKDFENAIYKSEFRELFPAVRGLLLTLSQGLGCAKCRAKNIKNAYTFIKREYPEALSKYFEEPK